MEICGHGEHLDADESIAIGSLSIRNCNCMGECSLVAVDVMFRVPVTIGSGVSAKLIHC